MADLKTILNYQELDADLLRLESEIDKSEQKRAALSAQKAVKDVKESADRLEAQARDLVSFYNKAVIYYSENVKKIEELEKRFEDEEAAPDERKKLKAALRTLLDVFSKMEQNLSGYGKNIEDIQRKYMEIKKTAQASMESFRTSKQSYDEFRKSKESRFTELREGMKSLEKKIEPSLLAKYASLRAGKTLPALVPLVSGNSCGGCRMEMSIATVSAVKENGFAECEYCRRIIY